MIKEAKTRIIEFLKKIREPDPKYIELWKRLAIQDFYLHPKLYPKTLAVLYNVDPESAKTIHRENNALVKRRGHSWMPIGTEVNIRNPNEHGRLDGRIKAYLGDGKRLIETSQGLFVKELFVFNIKNPSESYQKGQNFRFNFTERYSEYNDRIFPKFKRLPFYLSEGIPIRLLDEKEEMIDGKIIAYLKNGKCLIETKVGLYVKCFASIYQF